MDTGQIRRNKQAGATSLAFAMVVITIMATVVITGLDLSRSGFSDATELDEGVASLYLAESGLERAEAIIKAAARNGTMSNSVCTNFLNQQYTLGRGNFRYTGAYVSNAANLTSSTCNVSSADCKCVLTVQGTIGNISRSIMAPFSSTKTDGVEGYGHQFSLNLQTLVNNSFAFTHLAYNPPSNWGGDAVAGYCTNNGSGSLTTCTESWKNPGFYYNNTASQGVFATVANAGTYTINQEFKTNATPQNFTDRNYVEVGVVFQPLGGTVNHVGSYASTTNNSCLAATAYRTNPVTALADSGNPNSTGSTCNTSSYLVGYLPPGWTCNANGGTTSNWANAAGSNTLILGIGGKPYTGHTGTVTAISLNGQPLNMQIKKLGNQGDGMYSELWYAYNPAYDSNVSGASNQVQFNGGVGGAFNGTIGGSLKASTTSGSKTITVTSVTYGQITLGDSVSGTGIPTGATISAFGTGAGGNGTYQITANATSTGTNRTLTVASTKLVVSGMVGGAIRISDTLSASSCTGSLGPNTTVAAFGTGTSGGLGSYTLSGAQTVNCPSGSAKFSASSSVLRVSSVTSQSNSYTGIITNGDMTNSTFGNRTISYPISSTGGSAGTGGTGDYILSGAQQTINGASSVPGADQATSQLYSSTTVRVNGATGTAPSVGTALSVATGTGQLAPDNVTGYISGTTLTVTNVPTSPTQLSGPCPSSTSATCLSAGDALFGNGVLVNTVITARGTGTGGTGTYTISPSQTVGSSSSTIAITARPAVKSVTSVNSYMLSRMPDTAISAARLCGGLCPFLLGDGTSGTGNHAIGQFDLSGIQNYDDWSAGFSCLSGVDPSTIQNLGIVTSKRSNWIEPIQ